MKKAMLRRIFTFCAASCMLMPVSAVFAETIDDAPAVAEMTEEWETTTTTTTTCDYVQTDPTEVTSNMLHFCVEVVHEESGEQFEDVNVRLEKRYYYLDEGHYVYTGEIEFMESWNTSDENPHVSAYYPYSDATKPSSVFAVIDEIPDGYSWDGQEVCQFRPTGTREDHEKHTTQLKLRKEKYYDYENFPITGTYTKIFSVIDVDTREPILNLECAVVNVETGEEVYCWNTSEEPSAVVSGLEYRFEDWKMKMRFRISSHLRICRKIIR